MKARRKKRSEVENWREQYVSRVTKPLRNGQRRLEVYRNFLPGNTVCRLVRGMNGARVLEMSGTLLGKLEAIDELLKFFRQKGVDVVVFNPIGRSVSSVLEEAPF